MEFIQIFNKRNGQPKLLEYDEFEGYHFDDRYYTKVIPPDSINTPCEFVGGEWQSLSEQPEKVDIDELNEIVNNEKDVLVPNLLLKQAENDMKIQDLEETNAMLMLKLAGGIEDVLPKD